nr:hypothetical protein Itr_chr10CG15800 [Ipomoea trifida]
MPFSVELKAMLHKTPRPMGGVPSILNVLQSMARDNKQHFKEMKKVIHRTRKATDETKAFVVQEANATRTFVETQLPHTSQTGSSSCD